MELNIAWEKAGVNCGSDILVTEFCGHNAQVYKSFDDNLWAAHIDSQGQKSMLSEARAMEFAESIIEKKIKSRISKAESDLELFKGKGLIKVDARKTTVTWKKPNGETPDGELLVEVDTNNGSDCALVCIADDCRTLINIDEFGDVWTAWEWTDVSRYALMEDVLPKLS